MTWEEAWPWVAGGLATVLVVAALMYYLRRKNQNKPLLGPAKPVLPPHEIAFQSLEKLRAARLWQQNKVKQYYIELTEIIRLYIEQRFMVPALEQTSEEILESFRYRTNWLSPELQLKLKDMLTIADLVKFAKMSPLPDENDRHFSNAYHW
ncbi:MAG: hypothetical protein HC896_06305 [Bacteroidales bacterium]|nr:hypothetical protein [Bacteroidales bacterium]